ncbi:MAG: xanthine phosphoribosyltransferase [Lachnospiraceae bacterium]|jgi:xanthine phosphoribosyltransferase|nr:xanthine phosphoribosyltransferase [Lachnospiraceae bacterium]MCI9018993.1 xanthine phosphoribosyltransferase [Lachnospiraceae bacterium]MCI9683093.1 xanthine phosphoribosyltransferase [Lachnospiraceae bacterium]
MKLLEERILHEGIVIGQDILKVDGFINHQVDIELMEALGKDMAEHFAGQGVTKVFTIESSGIAPALFTAKYLNVPVVILKKQVSKNLGTEVWQTEVSSYTKDISYELTLAKNYISDTDHILIVDDFLANGEAATGAVRLIRKAHATIAGVGVLIEKAFQPGRTKLESQGITIYAQASIRAFENGQAVF